MESTNYISYDGQKYELKEGSTHKLANEQFLRNDSLTIHLTDPDLMVTLVLKKVNYKAIGLIGEKTIKSFTSDKMVNNELVVLLSKNSNAFPNGGLEPEYFVVTKKNPNMNDYWASMTYKSAEHENDLVNFFENYVKK